MPTTRDGEKITYKEFLVRWKMGIQGVTAIQRLRVTIWSQILILFGMSWGIIFAAIGKIHWLIIVLIGGFSISGLQLVATLQQYFVFRDMEEKMKGGIVIND